MSFYGWSRALAAFEAKTKLWHERAAAVALMSRIYCRRTRERNRAFAGGSLARRRAGWVWNVDTRAPRRGWCTVPPGNP